MAILVGIERKFITRGQGYERLKKIVDWLEKADRFHGAWPHWMNGETGKVKPFSKNDDGGDLALVLIQRSGQRLIARFTQHKRNY